MIGTQIAPIVLLVLSLALALPISRDQQPHAASACIEQVTNGGFESGSAPWQTVSVGGYTVISPILPHTGQWGAVLGAYDNANDELAQTITLPAGTTLTLRFWWQMTTLEANHPWDTLDVTVTPAGAGTPVRLLRITDGDPTGVWQQAVLDLSPHAGQTVRLSFRATTDSDRPTDFYLDDIGIEACPGVATATPAPTTTPTLTATLSPTQTATPTPTQTTVRRRIYLPLVRH